MWFVIYLQRTKEQYIMTQEEFEKEANALTREYNERMGQLRLAWAKSNAQFNRGDIVKRTGGLCQAFIVDKIRIAAKLNGDLDLLYEGRTVTKKLEPMARPTIIADTSNNIVLLKKAES
jgi:hypothetical protein